MKRKTIKTICLILAIIFVGLQWWSMKIHNDLYVWLTTIGLLFFGGIGFALEE